MYKDYSVLLNSPVILQLEEVQLVEGEEVEEIYV